MKPSDIVRQRLANQHLARQTFQGPDDVVRWLGAVQSQDYAAAKWAVAQRTKGLTDAAMDQALADGTILRTHILRPTWHFVAPEDIRWLLTLTASRVHAASAFQRRQLELSRAVLKRSNAALTRALRGGQQLTRTEIASVLRQAGIDSSGLRLVYLLMSAELDGVLCSGGRRGKQFTYALLEERAPADKTLSREEALAELTQRYFTGHGPATEEDFMWWSGLTRADVRHGIEMVSRSLAHEIVDGKTYWSAASTPPAQDDSRAAYLLPNYDEYVVGYTDRSAIFDSSHADQLDDRRNPLFQNTLVLRGQIAGTWKRTLNKHTVQMELYPFARLTKDEKAAVNEAAQKFGVFLGLEVTWG